ADPELVSASEIENVGREIAVAKCGACHATATTGDNPHPAAPAFLTLSQRYPLVYLEEALGEGIVTGHPDMPEIVLEPDAVAALLSYLASIQD
ncbi:MAG: c-type cytochrome, partial [Alphaproteobacteria bacterium]